MTPWPRRCESQRFPELGKAWNEGGPEPASALLADELAKRIAVGELDIPNIDIALIELYSLVLYPHFTHIAYGERISKKRADELINTGVVRFLTYYATAKVRANGRQ